MPMFSLEERDGARDHVLEMAASDARVVAAAVVGSLAHGTGDRWSDLDLTFGVTDEVPIGAAITDWTTRLIADVDAFVLFDLPSGETIYRGFLLPGGLQMDLSSTPASHLGSRGPRFALLCGQPHAGQSPE